MLMKHKQRSRPRRLMLLAAATSALLLGGLGCSGQVSSSADGSSADGLPPACTGGIDQDGDRYGQGCPAGEDCNDSDANIHPGAPELCDNLDNDCDGQIDEDPANACRTCSACSSVGEQPFATDPQAEPQLKEIDGLGLDAHGDLILDKTQKNFNYMWIANTMDLAGHDGGCRHSGEADYNPALEPSCRGTVSKIDTLNMKEVARYYTVRCQPGSASCLDKNGQPLQAVQAHFPSRTAVDYNFDVWVANRAFNGTPSATKIASDPGDCQDLNGDGIIQTSTDLNGDGRINPDCNGDGVGDSAATVCSDPTLQPEFLGDDDECVLFSVGYGEAGDHGRSICLDQGIDFGSSNAWVGTNNHVVGGVGENRFYRIAGDSGALAGPYPVAATHHPYGCVVDSEGILWATSNDGVLEPDGVTRHGGTLIYLDTKDPTQVSARLFPPWPNPHNNPPASGSDFVCAHYGITVDSADDVWLGGCYSGRTYRYRPRRSSGADRFAALGQGSWTGVLHPEGIWAAPGLARGVAADNRGKIWVAINEGFIWRIDQSIGEGLQTQPGEGLGTTAWATEGAGIIGVGVDFTGHVWGISYNNHQAFRLKVDAQGDPVAAAGEPSVVPVGKNPYTYSDFTGYGLQNFTRPAGTYVYQLEPCGGGKAQWVQVTWQATMPPGTSLAVQARSGDSQAALGDWTSPGQSSPYSLEALAPNPASTLQVKFTLRTDDKSQSPVLHDFHVSYTCEIE